MASIGDWRVDAASGTVVDQLRRRTDAHPTSPFLDFDGGELTYEATWRRASTLAAALRRVGLRDGETVVAMLDNNQDAVASWFAANMLGAIWVPINTALRGSFLRHVVDDAGAAIVLCENDFVERFHRIADGLPAVRLLVHRGGPPSAVPPNLAVEALDDLLAADPIEYAASSTSDDISCIVYTGGTTGPSKGCVITHGYVFNAAKAFLAQTGRRPDEVNWSPLPAYHFNLLSGTVVGTMLLGGRAAVAARFSVSRFWPAIEQTGARMVNLLGSMGALIAQMPDTPEMERCHGQIRVVHGAPFTPKVKRIWHERFGAEIVGANAFGLTEAFPLTTLEAGRPAPDGSSGKRNAADFDVRLFDDQDREVAVGQVGEVVCRPQANNVMFAGYWMRPDATLAVMRNLWFHTGDLGRFDDQGFFYFVDRKKDYLRRRGENISSQELEATYLQHPTLQQVAVHAVPSELGEDDVKVTAVLAADAELTPAQLFEWSKERMPFFALPRYIEFRAQLPMSAVGRVHKYQLREEGCTAATWDREQEDVVWDRR